MDRVRFPLLRTAGALALVASAALAFAQSASSPTGANMPSGPTSGAQQHRQPPPHSRASGNRHAPSGPRV